MAEYGSQSNSITDKVKSTSVGNDSSSTFLGLSLTPSNKIVPRKKHYLVLYYSFRSFSNGINGHRLCAFQYIHEQS